MSTLRDVIIANIKSAEEAIVKFQHDLAELEATDKGILDGDLIKQRKRIEGICQHMFSAKGNEVANADLHNTMLKDPIGTPALCVVTGGRDTPKDAPGSEPAAGAWATLADHEVR